MYYLIRCRAYATYDKGNVVSVCSIEVKKGEASKETIFAVM